MTPATLLLISAREAIAKPGGWGRVYNHRVDDQGRHCYCTYGALFATTEGVPADPTGGLNEAFRLLVEEAKALGYPDTLERGAVTHFNEDPKTSKKDVLALYDRAIERSRTMTFSDGD